MKDFLDRIGYYKACFRLHKARGLYHLRRGKGIVDAVEALNQGLGFYPAGLTQAYDLAELAVTDERLAGDCDEIIDKLEERRWPGIKKEFDSYKKALRNGAGYSIKNMWDVLDDV